jgi:hypothetical protein
VQYNCINLRRIPIDLLATCFHASITEDEGDVSPKRQSTFIGLHGVISKKIVLYIYCMWSTVLGSEQDNYNYNSGLNDCKHCANSISS